MLCTALRSVVFMASKHYLAHLLVRSCRNKSPEADRVLQPLPQQLNLVKLVMWAQQHYAFSGILLRGAQWQR